VQAGVHDQLCTKPDALARGSFVAVDACARYDSDSIIAPLKPFFPHALQLIGQHMRRAQTDPDNRLRLAIYRHLLRTGRAPSVAEMAKGLSWPRSRVEAGLARLSQSHAFMTQENWEIWRAAPFSAVPTAFPVRVGRRSYWANCIWDALGIPAMLHKDAIIGASCGCCNFGMEVGVKRGRLGNANGIIHIAVPARDWYKDVGFT